MTKFFSDIDLNKNQIQNVVLQPLAASPQNGNLGQVYFNSTDKKIYSHDGSNWSAVGGIQIYTDTIITTITWSGSGPYTQTVTLSNYTPTANTEVNLKADSTVISQLVSDGVNGLYVENLNGTLTMKAIGAAPTVALTIPVDVMEVTAAV